MTTVRETKRASELVQGDWIAPGKISPSAAEVLHTLTYPHPGEGNVVRTHLVLREVGVALPFDETFAAGYAVQLATAAELDELREQAGRARKIADIRALADFLEANPAVPAPDSIHAQASPGRDGDVWNSGAEGIAEVRRVAHLFGESVKQDDERTEVVKRFGGFEYTYIAWHKDGLPAEPVPVVDPDASMEAHYDAEAGYIVAGNAKPVDETEEEHHQTGGSVGGPGENGAECACGVVFDGFDSAAEANRMVGLHIEAATSPTGLTKAADESRGPLAFTTPVVTYFSFGHGQSDPDTGKNLLDHYVTVVAPTYEACREAMFDSRFGRAWSFDYLAGTARATEWIPRWTEHEVIVAPGTDPELAESALAAAREVLADDGDPFDAQDQAGRGVSW